MNDNVQGDQEDRSDDMLNALTRGIGAELGVPIRRSFYELRSALNKKEAFLHLSKQRKRLTLDLLGLSIFHGHVIVPLHGASNFFSSTGRYGVRKIQFGKRTLGSEEILALNRVTAQFFAITKAYGIGIRDLSIGNLDDFVTSVSNRND